MVGAGAVVLAGVGALEVPAGAADGVPATTAAEVLTVGAGVVGVAVVVVGVGARDWVPLEEPQPAISASASVTGARRDARTCPGWQTACVQRVVTSSQTPTQREDPP